MKILVTGGAGFIGSALVRHLIVQTSHQVLTLDKLTYAADIQALASVWQHPRHQFVQGDIADADAVQQILKKFQPDAVIHLAAETHVDRSIDGPGAFIQTNIIGTFQLLEVIRHYWEKLAAGPQHAFRFLQVSTDEVFGDLGDSEQRFVEEHPYAPSSPYSASKASADHLVRAWHRTYGLPVILSHCCNNYGPWQYPEKLIPLLISQALQHKPLPIYGHGLQVRDWLYVDDHARALLTVLEQGRVGESYLIGAAQPRQNIEVVHAVCETLMKYQQQQGQQGPDYKQFITYVADRPGHDQRYEIDASKIRLQLGWQPQETFETGLQKTVDWYLQHPAWRQQQPDKTVQAKPTP